MHIATLTARGLPDLRNVYVYLFGKFLPSTQAAADAPVPPASRDPGPRRRRRRARWRSRCSCRRCCRSSRCRCRARAPRRKPASAASRSVAPWSATLVITPTYDEKDNLPELVRALHREALLRRLAGGRRRLAGRHRRARRRARRARRPRSRCCTGARKLGLGTAYVAGFVYALDARLRRRVRDGRGPLARPALPARSSCAPSTAAPTWRIGSRNIPAAASRAGASGRHLLVEGRLGLRAHHPRRRRARPDHRLQGVHAARARGDRRRPACAPTATRSRSRRPTARCARGLRVVEVPIVFVDRRVGPIEAERRIFAEAIVEVWRLRLESLRGARF